MVASAYGCLGVENRAFRDNCICRHICMYTQDKVTKQWNYNNIVQILYSYLRYTNRLCGCLFLVAHCNIIRAS